MRDDQCLPGADWHLPFPSFRPNRRRLASLVDGAYFERLLTRFSVPEELFGPLSLAALERDEFQRNISGYLPTATVAFLDEVFKANSAILNTLLTVLNERAFHNGTSRVPVPLVPATLSHPSFETNHRNVY